MRHREFRGEGRAAVDLLVQQAIIYVQRAGGATWTFRQGRSETAVTVSGRLRVSAAEGIREAVFAGLGLFLSAAPSGCSRRS